MARVGRSGSAAKDPIGAVKDAAKATKQFVITHKDALIEIAAVGVGILAGMACTAITASAGAVACMIGASALVNLTKDALEGNVHSLGDALGSLGTGALQGLAGGVGGAVAGKLGTMVAGKVGSGLMGRLATEAVENGVDDVINQAVTTGRVNPKSAMMGMIPGLGAVERKSHGAGGTVAQDARKLNLIGGGGGGARCHSFAPDTKVLMGDRSQREIKDINVGDQVMSADPKSSGSKIETVTQLHRNTDHDLTKLTVKDQNNKKSVLSTTQNHPFWDATDHKWTDTKNLKAGHHLRVFEQGNVTVTRVANTTGTHEMRDLTVDELHTYYVLVGPTAVLVHNCATGKAPRTPDGKFATRNGEPGRDGADDEMNALDHLEMDGANVRRDETPVSVPGMPVRKYDGTVEIDSKWYGVETKGGTAKRSPAQKGFDNWLNTPGNTVTTKDGRTLVGVFDVWIDR